MTTVREGEAVAVLLRGRWFTGAVEAVLADGRLRVALAPHPESRDAPAVTVRRAVPAAHLREGRIPEEPPNDDDRAGFRFCPHCGHAIRPAGAGSAGRRYRALAITRLEPGGRRLEMGGRL